MLWGAVYIPTGQIPCIACVIWYVVVVAIHNMISFISSMIIHTSHHKLLTLKRTLKGIARYLSEVHCNKKTRCGGVVMGVLKTTWFLIDGRYGPVCQLLGPTEGFGLQQRLVFPFGQCNVKE